MDMIKTTPPEMGVPSFSIEPDYEAQALVELSTNPGVKGAVMLDLAKKVLRETRGLTYPQQIKEVEYLARKHLDASRAETETIAAKAQEATHRIIGGAHLFTGYEAPERPDYFPHDDGPSAA